MASKYSPRSGRLSSAKEKDIKKINERRAQIVREVKAGTLPKDALRRFENAMRAAAGDHINASGNIAHGKAAQAAISQEALDALLQRDTAGQLKKEIKKQVAEEYDKPLKDITKEDIEAYNEMLDTVNSYIEEHPERAYDKATHSGAFAIFRGVKGVKTYKQLQDAIDLYEGKLAAGEEIPPFDAEKAFFK
mgnify:CR=1 FL=1